MQNYQNNIGNYQQNSFQMRKLQPIMEKRDEFMQLIQQQNIKNFQETEENKQNFEQELAQQEEKTLEGRDITICVRTRPLLEHELNQNYFSIVNAHNPKFSIYQQKINLQRKPAIEKQTFDVDYSFGPEIQEDYIFQKIGPNLLDFAINGGISTLFAYGQTGSGKTYTIQGLNRQIADHIFQQSQPQHCIQIGFFELLGNEFKDLIDNSAKIEIFEDVFGKTQIKNLFEQQVRTKEEFLYLVQQAQAARKTQATFKNDVSSRTHSICQVRITNTSMPQAEDGFLYLIDLVGSENNADSQFHDKSMIKQSQEINKSLMILKECLKNRALASRVSDKHIHIPFRGTKLTQILKDTFDQYSIRQCKTVVIATVSPSVIDYQQSVNTLRYAGPIKVCFKTEGQQLQKNPNNPQFWDNQSVRNWMQNKWGSQQLDFDKIFPYESGKQVIQISQQNFIERFLNENSRHSQIKIVKLHSDFWDFFVSNRSNDRVRKELHMAQKSRQGNNSQADQMRRQWMQEKKDRDELGRLTEEQKAEFKKYDTQMMQMIKQQQNIESRERGRKVMEQRKQQQQKRQNQMQIEE